MVSEGDLFAGKGMGVQFLTCQGYNRENIFTI